MFKTAEKEANAFQKTISKEQKAYYRLIKKEERLAKKQEKKEFLNLCKKCSSLFKAAERKLVKRTRTIGKCRSAPF
jgi:hypothetical protein